MEGEEDTEDLAVTDQRQETLDTDSLDFAIERGETAQTDVFFPACIVSECETSQSGDDEAEDSIVIDYGMMWHGYRAGTDDAALFAETDAAGAQIDRSFELTEFTIKAENSTNIGSATDGGSIVTEEDPLTTTSFVLEIDPLF